MMLPTLMSNNDDVTHPNQPIEDPGLLNPQEGVDTPGEGVLLLQGGHRGTGHLKQKHICYILFNYNQNQLNFRALSFLELLQ